MGENKCCNTLDLNRDICSQCPELEHCIQSTSANLDAVITIDEIDEKSIKIKTGGRDKGDSL